MKILHKLQYDECRKPKINNAIFANVNCPMSTEIRSEAVQPVKVQGKWLTHWAKLYASAIIFLKQNQ